MFMSYSKFSFFTAFGVAEVWFMILLRGLSLYSLIEPGENGEWDMLFRD